MPTFFPSRRLMCLMAAAVLFTLQFSLAQAERFSFMAIGDMPYSVPGDLAAFERLIARVNQIRPAFTVHVGDIKSGVTQCSDEALRRVLGLFNIFDQPLIYTPGDNEWTDCHRTDNGSRDPLERLATIREMFFGRPESLGRTPIALQHQSADPDYARFVENTRWERSGVVFATAHIVGSNNNLQRDRAAAGEYFERNAANLAWITAAFSRAREIDAKAVVLCFQADLLFEKDGEPDSRSGFNDTLALLRQLAPAFGRPVLLVHGDKHRLLIDQPLTGSGRKRVMNVVRLMVHGDREVHGTLVEVDTDDPAVFAFRPVLIPANFPRAQPAR